MGALPSPRRADSAVTRELYETLQAGILRYDYKGIRTYKCPFDLALYTKLLHELRPATIVEFGSNKGGSALWFADTLDALGLSSTRLYTLDHVFMHDYTDPRVNFMECDISDIYRYIPRAMINTWAKPLLVIDDASHQYRHSLNILDFFDDVSSVGDYIIVEDGIATVVNEDEQYDGGPHRAIYEFLARRGTDYEVDREYCDYYGLNVTWNPDGYIKRVARR